MISVKSVLADLQAKLKPYKQLVKEMKRNLFVF